MERMTDLRSAPVPGLRPEDRIRGAGDAPLLIIYADLACPRCALAWERVRDAPLRLCLRHFALRSKHPRAVALAHAAEAAAAQGAFWEFVEARYADQGHVDDPHLWAWAEQHGLDVGRFDADRRGEAAAERVQRDVRDAIRAGATATPTIFVAGRAGWTVIAGPPDPPLVREWAAIG